MDKKYIYFFSKEKSEGNAKMKSILGGKGANLAEMAKIGIPVPPGFTISAEVCQLYLKTKKIPSDLKQEIEKNLSRLEKVAGKKFGDENDPLLVSVRSGAAVSMPGMMDTILNLGLNSKSVEGLVKKSNDEKFAWDAFRRLIQMFGDVVMGIAHSKFEKELEKIKEKAGVKQDIELEAEDLKELVKNYKALYKKETGKEFPESPKEQLFLAIEAVFKSWNNPRAIKYREINNIEGLLGTATNVQAMVFGNLGLNSATGVAFTRNPATGENQFYGEYLPQAQGEDVVAGIRTPRQLTKKLSQKWAKENKVSEAERKNKYPSLEESMPEVFKDLMETRKKLERHYQDMQDIEFTIQEGKLYLLQTRTGKRTGKAAVKIAVDLVKEKIIDKKTALLRVEPEKINELLHKRIDPTAKISIIGKGLPASPGAAVGRIVFEPKEAVEFSEKGEPVILVRQETSPDDIGGMSVSQGILTAVGGMTSHASVVARGMGKSCVVGCSDLSIDYKNKICSFRNKQFKEGDFITIDGDRGLVAEGKVDLVFPELSGEFLTLLKWADQIKKLSVRANAETPKDAQKARELGAEGIGLARTEHMFFGKDRVIKIQKMILAKNEKEREKAINSLLPLQKNDFLELFKIMKGLPVTVRLLDPPLHEFLPKTEEETKELAEKLGITIDEIKKKMDDLKEVNPMLGHRGCRLGITYPEITKMQVRAIIEAAIELNKQKIKVMPEIMVPLVSIKSELEDQMQVIKSEANESMKRLGKKIKYKIGTMIETPRACAISDKIAENAEFFSFGTNDLTQMTFGFSRDDIAKFLPFYIEKNIVKNDPFMVLDQEGVGKLMKMAISQGREVKPNLKIGICGEHGGEPSSVEFCHKIGLDYVSCSPYRVPIARLAAAQAVIKNKK